MKFYRGILASLTLLLTSAGVAPGQTGTISTIAGLALGDGGQASAVTMLYPTSVAIDSSGNQYVLDSAANRVWKITPGGISTVFAGTGGKGYNSDNIPANTAHLSTPSSIALDTSGNLYISDTQNNRIRKVTAATGIITTIAGNGTTTFSGDNGQATSAGIYYPFGICVNAANDVFIADSGHNRIRKVSGGNITTVLGDGVPATLNQPYGVAVHSSGDLYVADRGNHRVLKVPNGQPAVIFAGTGVLGFSGDNGAPTSAQLNSPAELSVNEARDVFIADSGNNRIRKVSGTVISTLAGTGSPGYAGDPGPATSAQLFYPLGVGLDSASNVYIGDSGNGRVRKVIGTTISLLAGNGAPGYTGDGVLANGAALFAPSSVVVDSANNIYISDTQNARIRKIRSIDGVIETYAGTGASGFSGDDGPPTGATFQFPRGLAIDNSGNLYIADENNNRIRKISGGIISTVAGNGTSGFGGDNGQARVAMLNHPKAVAVDAAGNLYIADWGNHRIRKVATNGTITTVAGNGSQAFAGDGQIATLASLSNPSGVAVDAAGVLYISDTGNHRIRMVAAGSNIISTIAGTGASAYSGDGGQASLAALNSPNGIMVSSAGSVLFADKFNSRIRIISGSIINSLAGNGLPGYGGDGGPATNASLFFPLGLGADAAGNLYIADTDSNHIRKVLGVVPVIASSTITVNTAPSGLAILVDGVSATAPQTYTWTPGTSHTIAVTSPQGSGTRYAFSNWSDGLAISHSITAPAGSATYTANFTTQYLLTTATNPGGGGSIIANPISGDGYYNSGASVQLTASPASGFSFSFFSGSLTGSTNPQSVSMTAQRSVTANFSSGTGGNVPPYGLDLSPFQGAGVTQTFTGTFNDANGWTDIAKATFFFHESYAGTFGPCTVELRPQSGQITVVDDGGVNFLPAVTLGSAATVQNSVCSVNAAGSSFSGSGNVLTANVALTFKPAFGTAGGREPRKAVCQWARDTAGAGEPQSCFGLWIPEAPAPTKIPRFRLYNPANYAHFFTASQHENDVLVGRGFTPEPSPGVVFDQPTSVDGVPTRAYYRILFFPTNGAPIFHYWTRDRDEYKAAIRLRGLNLGEGVDSFMLTGPVPNTFPLSRLLFTAGPSPYPIYHYALEYETSVLLGMGWGVSLGVDGYLYPPQVPAAAKAPSARIEKRISSVLNAASHDAGPVAPGQLVRVYGRDFSKLAQAFIDGSAVPLLAVTNTYLELAVPDSVAGKESIELSVDDLGVRTETVTLAVAAARPAVFVKDFLGRGLIETLPSEAGTVTLQVTGAGELELGQPKFPLSVRLNGYPADILSIATIADQPGRLAVNVKFPAEVLAGDTDLATLSLQIGEANAQPGLLVRVR